MMTYDQAAALLRNPAKGKPLAGNTRLFDRREYFAARYGTYRLNSGGWRTRTTKSRINQYAPVTIFQRDFVRYISDTVPFRDGMVFNPFGEII